MTLSVEVTSAQKETIRLRQATASDVPALSTIFNLSMEHDAHTALKIASKPPGTEELGMAECISSWVINPSKSRILLKAVINDEIVGWACWGWKGAEFPVFQGTEWEGTSSCQRDAERDDNDKMRENQPVKAALMPENVRGKSGLEQLEEITNSDMEQWQESFMGAADARCFVLIAIAVHPAFQGKGVGSALVHWGTSRADEAGMFTWVSSSDGGWTAFQKMGFRFCGGLRVVLDDFAGGVEKANGSAWGTYTWRYGKRTVTGQEL